MRGSPLLYLLLYTSLPHSQPVLRTECALAVDGLDYVRLSFHTIRIHSVVCIGNLQDMVFCSVFSRYRRTRGLAAVTAQRKTAIPGGFALYSTRSSDALLRGSAVITCRFAASLASMCCATESTL